MVGSLSCLLAVSIAAGPASPGFTPDPVSVEREGPAYRYPQAGWIVLHIEGEPYERGFQHGKLLAPEIERYVRCYAAMQSPKAPGDGWQLTRLLADALFTRRIEPEYLEELKGIADGAAAGGAKFQGRSLDLTDVVAINVWPEVMTLDNALEATPTGLEGRRFPGPQAPRPPAPPEALRCSAFAATGPATRDGKAVIGHITMFSLYACNFFNVWIDLKPKRGHRVLYQTSPGGIQSGLDYYMNDAGLVLCETTIAQTRFNAEGASLGSQSRKAMQYADSIDKAVGIFLANGNGLYTNEWLLADTKTNEIALFELGTRVHRLMRSSRNEWFGGTDGFYWGCNNTKDLEVRLETIASTADRPENMVFVPTERDRKWVELYREHRGRIDADFGKLAFTSTPLAYHSSCDAKFTTSDLARDLKTSALAERVRGLPGHPDAGPEPLGHPRGRRARGVPRRPRRGGRPEAGGAPRPRPLDGAGPRRRR
jgi:Phospholipase B